MRVDRQVAMRAIAKVMRDKQARFEQEKAAYPKLLEKTKRVALTRLAKLTKQLRNGITPKELEKILGADVMPWEQRSKLMPGVPSLNVCQEQHYLEMLQKDVRDVLPINSNSDLWSLLESKCEVIRG